MTLTGQEFYKNFFCRFQEHVKADKKGYDRTTTDPLWTAYIKDFLGKLAKDLGFNQEKHEDVYKIDFDWKRTSDHASVAIEHENDPKDLFKKEVPNLLNTAAHLKVLITYVSDTDFPGDDLANRLLERLKKEPAFSHEFLLILGTWSMKEPTDWIAHLYQPEVTSKTLVFCSNMLEAEKSPGKKAWKTRKETEAGDNESAHY
jgi:hypothetical protein